MITIAGGILLAIFILFTLPFWIRAAFWLIILAVVGFIGIAIYANLII